MGPLLTLKFACATLTGYIYIHRYPKNQDSALIAAVLYAFSGFSVYNIFFNHFHEAIVFFPLLLAALDEYKMCIRDSLRHHGHGEAHRPLHLLLEDALHLFPLLRGALHDEFVVDLEDELALQALPGQTGADANHGDFDDVRRRPLDGHVPVSYTHLDVYKRQL